MGGGGPVVWIVSTQHWPRALLRAELIERGFDAAGHASLAHALAALRHPYVPRPRLIVLELRGLAAGPDQLEALARSDVPVLLLGGAIELAAGWVAGLEWAAVIRRPFSIGAVADRVEELLGASGG